MIHTPDAPAADYGFIHFAYLEDEVIAGLYDRMEEEGLLDSFAYDSQFDGREAFLRYARASTWGFVAMRDQDLVAFAWLDAFSGRSAYFHHCHFLSGWRCAKATARATLEWLAKVRPVDVLIGVTPETNTLAVRYAMAAGFHILGTIPQALFVKGEPKGAVVSYLELKEIGQ